MQLQNRKTYRDRKEISSCLGLGSGSWRVGWEAAREGNDSSAHGSFFQGDKMFYNWLSWWLRNSVHILRATESYTLDGWITWLVNFVSTRLLKSDDTVYAWSPKAWFHYMQSMILLVFFCLFFLKNTHIHA